MGKKSKQKKKGNSNTRKQCALVYYFGIRDSMGCRTAVSSRQKRDRPESHKEAETIAIKNVLGKNRHSPNGSLDPVVKRSARSGRERNRKIKMRIHPSEMSPTRSCAFASSVVKRYSKKKYR